MGSGDWGLGVSKAFSCPYQFMNIDCVYVD